MSSSTSQISISRISPLIIEVEFAGKLMKFIVTSTPTENTAFDYLEVFREHQVSHIIRTCSPFYSKKLFTESGFEHQDLIFSDSSFPSKRVIHRWLKIVDSVLKSKKNPSIAVHCLAGYGRSFLLVIIALVARFYLKPKDAMAKLSLKHALMFSEGQVDSIMQFRGRKKTHKVCSIM